MQSSCIIRQSRENARKLRMNTRTLFFPIVALSLIALSPALRAEEASLADPSDYFYEVGKIDYMTGEGAHLGNFIFPTLHVQGTGGLFEPGAGPGEFATSEHDPLNEGGVQGIEPHLKINLSDTLTGAVVAFGHMGEDEIWEIALEEYYLHWHLNDWLSIGGGQFFSRIGFQQDLHLHEWFFVNQNLTNSRLINEGELIIQGGEILIRLPENALLTLGFGGVQTHAEEEEDDPPMDPDFIEAHAGEFQNTVVSADYRFRLPFDDSIIGSASLIGGNNAFGRDTTVYSLGLRKIWNGHDHQGNAEFCSGALMLQSEFFTREVDGFTLGGAPTSFNDKGVATSIHYGINDRVTASLRHDWVSDVAKTEFTDRNRLSAALTAFVDPLQRVRARFQYDHVDDDAVGSENVAWLQIQIQWGGTPGSHSDHDH